MDIDYACEFLEDGRVIDLISVGMVAGDGREYYAVVSDAPWERIREHDWLMRNVVPHLPVTGRVLPDLSSAHVRPRWVIANEVREFITVTPQPRLWAWQGAYAHVALCQLWGSRAQLPPGVPARVNDLKQECERLGNPELPRLDGAVAHHALHGARECRFRRRWLADHGSW